MPHGDQLYSEKSSSSFLEEELLGLVLFLKKNVSDWARRATVYAKRSAGFSNFTWHFPALRVWVRILLIGPFLVTTSLIGPGVQQPMPRERGLLKLYLAKPCSMCLSKNSFDWSIFFCSNIADWSRSATAYAEGAGAAPTLLGIAQLFVCERELFWLVHFFVKTSLIGPGVQQPMQRERGLLQLYLAQPSCSGLWLKLLSLLQMQ